MGQRRVMILWAVGNTWERFSLSRKEAIQCSFIAVGLSLPIDGSHESLPGHDDNRESISYKAGPARLQVEQYGIADTE